MAGGRHTGSGRSGHRLALVLGTGIVLAWLGAMTLAVRDAALPPEATGTVLAVFPSKLGDDAAFAAMTRAGGRPIRPTWLPGIWVVSGDEPGFAGRLEAEGAVGVYGDLPIGPQLAGCFAWVNTKVVKLVDMRP
ncbi:hypothetical protein HW532_20460 [Kaustia mangrovi]|uniref:Uncharacterized protein n=1 Tax=Kaustia mangrovi TaxID=2593653 RepID=A0A7S8C7K3_9HYPH|nr:hypothetical protein [Kaustia mangrovi]QPC44860.1 hypothetical protein HW532_20460 [Kaustia mangrovi]